jgi:carbon-monoxide dehydrogenase large subunit
LKSSSHSHGQGHETSFAQVVADVLGVPMDIVKLRTGEPGMRVGGGGTSGSRSMVSFGSSYFLGAQEVVKKGRELAAQELEASPEDIEFKDGEYCVKGTDLKITLLELAKKHKGTDPHPLNSLGSGKWGMTFPNGAHIAEVEIDPETGVTEIVSYIAVDDIGNIITHALVEGQMQGGLTQGAGQVLGEHAIYDHESGQLLTGSFMDYPMPRAIMVAGLKLLDHPVPTKLNPLGAKGVGEAGCTGALPTLANAIVDALRTVGVTHFDTPATPQRVWAAIEAAKAGKPRALQVYTLEYV